MPVSPRASVSLLGSALLAVAFASAVSAQSPSPSAGPSANPSPSSATASTSPAPSSGIEQVSDEPGFAGAIANGIVQGTDGSFVMVGTKGADPFRPDQALAWHSSDGRTWKVANLPHGTHVGGVGIAAGPKGWFAVGTGPFGSGTTGWSSTDGETWRAVKLPKGVAPGGVATVPEGTVVLGTYLNAHRKVQPALWVSNDLKKWTRHDLPGTGTPLALAQNGAGQTIVSVVDTGANGLTYSVVASAGGIASPFSTVTLPPAPAGSTLVVHDVGVAGELLAVVADLVASDNSQQGVVYTSSDASTWQQAYEASGPLLIAATGAPLTVLGTGTYAMSADGATWTSGVGPSLANAHATTATDGTILVADSAYGPGGLRVTVSLVPAAGEGGPDASPVASESAAPASPVASENPASPGASSSADATALVGTWTLVTLAGETVPATPAITLTLDADGSSVLTVDCKPDKGSHAPTLSTPYTVDGSTIDIGVGTFSANCKDTDAQTLLQTYSFGGALATHPGSWSVSADTLTITGHGQTVVFDRSA